LEIAEKEKGGMAIHCKAGLGRTGSLIGLYAMKHFGFPAAPFTGWIRIARPGSILGPQQHYLLVRKTKVEVSGNGA
jgi:cell division cycle 14